MSPSAFSYFFLSVVCFFFCYACVHAILTTGKVKRTYFLYAFYLASVFFYFSIKANEYLPHRIQTHLESFAVLMVITSYLFFIKYFFHGRASYDYFRNIANFGIYISFIAFLVERLLHIIAPGQVHVIEGVTRAMGAALGIYAIIYTYFKVPADRLFLRYFLVGNSAVLLGAICTTSLTAMRNFVEEQHLEFFTWLMQYRMLPIQMGILIELVCFTIVINKLQLFLLQAVPLSTLNTNSINFPIEPDSLSKEEESSEEFVTFRKARGFEMIKKKFILYLEGGGNSANFIHLYLENQSLPTRLHETLAHCMKLLGDVDFMLIHRSYLVNLSKIRSVSKDKDGVWEATLLNSTKIPISRKKIDELHRRWRTL